MEAVTASAELPLEIVAPESESPVRTLTSGPSKLARVLAVALACYSLYWVVGIVQPLVYRVSFLLGVLVLTFLVYPATSSARDRARVPWADWTVVGLATAALLWPLLTFDAFIYHAADPSVADRALGAILIVLCALQFLAPAGFLVFALAVNVHQDRSKLAERGNAHRLLVHVRGATAGMA